GHARGVQVRGRLLHPQALHASPAPPRHRPGPGPGVPGLAIHARRRDGTTRPVPAPGRSDLRGLLIDRPNPVSLFVTFEGIEGSGRPTHARTLAAHLRAAGHEVLEPREPGGTPAGEALRALLLGPPVVPLEPLAELHIYCADRAQHVAAVIRPA